MPRVQHVMPPIVFALVLLFPIASRADDSDGVFTGSGVAVIKRQPQILRGQFMVTGDAKDAAGAIAKLKESQAAARAKLTEMGAIAKSIEIGPTQMGGAPLSAREQYAQYMQELQRSMGQPGIAKPPAKAQTVTVSSTIKAEWALTGAGPEEVFIAGCALRDKIKSAEIGKLGLKKLSPEEQEVAEEASGMKGAGAGEPAFQFVCKISDADRAAALAEAFGKARRDAAELASAAGTELAALRHLTRAMTSPTAVDDSDQFLKRMLMQQSGMAAPAAAETPSDEASAPNPISVELQITVTASFAQK